VIEMDDNNLTEWQLENERMLVASAYISPNTAVSDAGWIEGCSFIDQELGNYWERIKSGCDPIEVAIEMGIAPELLKYSNRLPTAMKAQSYAREIDKAVYLRRALKHLSNAAKLIYQRDVVGVEKELNELLDSSPNNDGDIACSAIDLDKEFRVMLSDPNLGGVAIKSAIPTLDKRLGGFFRGEISVLAARPGMGKTAVSFQIARNMARAGNKVLYLSLEMSRMQLWARAACPLAGYTWLDVRSGDVNSEGLEKIAIQSQNLQTIYGDNLLIHDSVSTLPEMYQVVSKYMPDFIVVDHLGEIMWHVPSEEEIHWYGKALKFMLRFWSKALNCHTLVIHQLSRKVEERKDKRPQLQDLRWSGEIEQRADVVLMCYRDDYYLDVPTNATVVPFELWIKKNRQGAMNKCVMLDYDLKKQWFEEPNVKLSIPIPTVQQTLSYPK